MQTERQDYEQKDCYDLCRARLQDGRCISDMDVIRLLDEIDSLRAKVAALESNALAYAGSEAGSDVSSPDTKGPI